MYGLPTATGARMARGTTPRDDRRMLAERVRADGNRAQNERPPRPDLRAPRHCRWKVQLIITASQLEKAE